jgi:hypothetical protein
MAFGIAEKKKKSALFLLNKCPRWNFKHNSDSATSPEIISFARFVCKMNFVCPFQSIQPGVLTNTQGPLGSPKRNFECVPQMPALWNWKRRKRSRMYSDTWKQIKKMAWCNFKHNSSSVLSKKNKEKKGFVWFVVHNEWLISIHPTRTLQQTWELMQDAWT